MAFKVYKAKRGNLFFSQACNTLRVIEVTRKGRLQPSFMPRNPLFFIYPNVEGPEHSCPFEGGCSRIHHNSVLEAAN